MKKRIDAKARINTDQVKQYAGVKSKNVKKKSKKEPMYKDFSKLDLINKMIIRFESIFTVGSDGIAFMKNKKGDFCVAQAVYLMAFTTTEIESAFEAGRNSVIKKHKKITKKVKKGSK